MPGPAVVTIETDNAGVADTGRADVRGFIWPDEVTLDNASVGNKDVLAQVLLAGRVHYGDIVLPAGESENDLKTALRSGCRERGLWIEGLTQAGGVQRSRAAADPQRLAALTAYAARERDEIEGARRRLAELKSTGAVIAIWGMATKGIVYSLLVDPGSTLIDVAVDINANKQGCYVPTTGRLIEAPAALQRLSGGGGRRAAVVVMNPNYVDEIRGMCVALGVSAEFLDATGQRMAVA